MSHIWPEVQKAIETKRYELILVGSDVSKRIEDNQGKLDENLFKLKNLNLLEISRTKLAILQKEIYLIENLTSLLCHSNELVEIPSEIGKLVHLKNLDLSNNKINKLPQELSNLKELFTLNLGGNQLDALFPLNGLSKLAVLNISKNQFKELPNDLGSASLENLSEINASFNKLENLNQFFGDLPSLKLLNLENNSITHVPSDLCQCIKLKDLILKDNKLKDNRLQKLIDQNKMKPIIDYLEKLHNEELKTKSSKEKQKPKKIKDSDSEKIIEYDLINVIHLQNDKYKGREIFIDDTVVEVRPFILCAILRDVDLETPGNLKKFLNIQTKLHEEECQKRTLATIATHDLMNVIGNLSYEAADPTRIELVPLGRKYPIEASEYYFKLMEEAEAERKAKKRNQLSGIYKYLTLLEKQNRFAFLRDSENVISLPPLTNAEKTKLSVKTRDILIEITSTYNLDTCKMVMEKLLFNMLQAGLNSKYDLSIDLRNENKEEKEKIKNKLLIQQVKIMDSKSNLKHVYPSRIDLDFNEYKESKVKVKRLYDEI